MMNNKKIFSMLKALILSFGIINTSYAESLPLTGTCGNGCLYEITTDSTTGEQNLRVYNDPNYTGTTKTIADNAFRGSGKTSGGGDYKEGYANAVFSKIIIDGDFDSIGYRAFQHNNANEVIFNGNIKTISAHAFGFNNFTSVNLPQTLQSIGSEAFYDGKFLSITIPDSVTSIGSYAFYTNGPTTIYMADTLTHLGKVYPFGNNFSIICQGDVEKCQNLVKEYYPVGSSAPTDLSGNVFAADKYQCSGNYFWNGAGCVREPDKSKRTCCVGCKFDSGSCWRVRYSPAEAAKIVGESNTILLYYK